MKKGRLGRRILREKKTNYQLSLPQMGKERGESAPGERKEGEGYLLQSESPKKAIIKNAQEEGGPDSRS